MDTNTRTLRNEISRNLGDLERQISQVYRIAEEMKTDPSRVQDSQGNLLLTPLLVAKAQGLHALTLLQRSSN